MRRLSKIGLFGFLAIVAVLLCMPAAIGAQSQETYTIPAIDPAWDDSIAVDLFDSSLGTLTQVDLTFTATLSGSMGYENTDAEIMDSVELTMEVASRLLDSDNNTVLISTSLYQFETASDVPVYDGNTNYSGTSGQTFALGDQDTGSTSLTSSADLLRFTGTGTITLYAEADGEDFTFTYDSGKTAVSTYTSLASASLTVTYTYTPIPEPNLLVFVTCGLLWLRRPRRRK